MNRSSVIKYGQAAVATLLLCVPVVLTGCATGFTVTPDNSPVVGDPIHGVVHGGQQPVSGATIQLWYVGATGYGSAATKLGPALTTFSDGTFTYTPGSYTCPTGTTQTYITSTGGNPGLGTGANSNIQLMAAMGNCSGLSSATININEVTTVAAAFALGQYFTPGVGGPNTGDSFGAPNTTQAQAAIANAMATASNLAVTSTGLPVTTLNVPSNCSSGTLASPCVTVTPESTKIYTIANILAACVNSAGGVAGDGSGCGILFGDVVPTSGTAPTDTLQAAVYMSLNPTSNNANGSTTNLAALCNAQWPNSPWIGNGLVCATAQPTDWTIGIQYTDTTNNTFLTDPQNIAADSSGNIWVLNSAGAGGLAEVSPTGSPLNNALTSATAGTGVNGQGPRNIAIDQNNDVWVTSSTGTSYIFEVNPAGATLGTSSTGKSSYGIAIDGNNNVFVGSASTTSHFELYEYPATNSATTPASGNLSTPIVYPIATGTPGTAGTNGANAYVLPQYMAIDTSGNVWMTNGSATTGTSSNFVVELTNINISQCSPYVNPAPCPAGGTGATNIPLTTSTSENTFTGINPVTMAAPFGLAANTNGMWVASGTGSTYTLSDLVSTTTGTNYGSSTSIGSSLRYVAVDGSGNVWVSNKGGSPTGIMEFSNAGTPLSPVSTGTAPFTAVGYVHGGLSSCLGVTIDPSGNVWVANSSTTAGIFEIVGAASPTVTPISLALKNSAVGAKP